MPPTNAVWQASVSSQKDNESRIEGKVMGSRNDTNLLFSFSLTTPYFSLVLSSLQSHFPPVGLRITSIPRMLSQRPRCFAASPASPARHSAKSLIFSIGGERPHTYPCPFLIVLTNETDVPWRNGDYPWPRCWPLNRTFQNRMPHFVSPPAPHLVV